MLSTLDLTDPNLTDFTFIVLYSLTDNQPTKGLESISVKESPVGGRLIGRSPQGLTKQWTFYTNRQGSFRISLSNQGSTVCIYSWLPKDALNVIRTPCTPLEVNNIWEIH